MTKKINPLDKVAATLNQSVPQQPPASSVSATLTTSSDFTRTTVYLERNTVRRMKHIQADTGQSLSHIVRELLADYLEKHDPSVSNRSIE